MQSFSEIVEKIKELKGLINDYEVADLLNIKPKTLGAAKNRGSIPFEEITAFCNKEGISLNWLLTNEGPKRILNKYPEASTTSGSAPTINDPAVGYQTANTMFTSDQKINIEEAMGKAYTVLSAGTALSVALYMNIQQFAAALNTGHALQYCQDQMKDMQAQIDALKQQVDRLTAAPAITEGQGDGSVKKAM